jgi:hypothetical protein
MPNPSPTIHLPLSLDEIAFLKDCVQEKDEEFEARVKAFDDYTTQDIKKHRLQTQGMLRRLEQLEDSLRSVIHGTPIRRLHGKALHGRTPKRSDAKPAKV